MMAAVMLCASRRRVLVSCVCSLALLTASTILLVTMVDFEQLQIDSDIRPMDGVGHRRHHEQQEQQQQQGRDASRFSQLNVYVIEEHHEGRPASCCDQLLVAVGV